MIGMKPRWYETRAALRAISNFLAFSEKSNARQLQKKNKTSVCRRCELIVHELMTESLRCLMRNQQKYIVSIHVNVSNFQKFAFLENIKATKLSTLLQNHSFLVSKIDACCLRFSFDGTISWSCLLWGQLFVAGKWMCLSHFACGCSAFGTVPQS